MVVGGTISVFVGGGSWWKSSSSWFSRTFHVGRRVRVPLRADEVDGTGGSICSFSSTARERKQEINSSSVVCRWVLVSWHWTQY